MKRLIALLVLSALLLLQCGCNKAEDTAQQPADQFMIGYGRISIHSKENVPLGSFEGRTSTGFLDYVQATCIAVTGENNETVLLYTTDTLYSYADWVDPCREKVSAATGIAQDHIMFSSTHTHSAPDIGNRVGDKYTEFFIEQIVEVAKQALEDRAPATIQTGSTQVDNMNYIRHYMMSDGTIAGDHFGNWDTATAEYNLSEPDKELQLVRFVREDKDDVVIANFQAHAKLASSGSTNYGNQNRTMMSADFIGATRDFVESNMKDVKFAFFIGASGNINPFDTHIKANLHREYLTEKAYGQTLGSIIIENLMFMKDTSAEYDLQCKQSIMTGDLKAGPGTYDFEVDAIALGDSICFVTTPFETFNSTGMAIKDGSPYETTFILSNANDSFSYLPDEAAFLYGGYEVKISKFASGTAEKMADHLVDILNEMHK